VSLLSNVARHSPSLLPPESCIPRPVYLTVHTIALQLAHLTAAVAAAACEAAGIAAPAWLALAAYGPDALLLGLGLVVWLAYYGMVHFEPEFRGYARFTAMGRKVILLRPAGRSFSLRFLQIK
jgi:hypothetical protein